MEKIYVLPIESGLDENTFHRLLPLLSAERQARICRNRFDTDKTLGLFAALLVRTLACQTLGIPNHALRFAEAEHGKPYLCSHPTFHFNVSHTENAVAVAIANRPIGVDIEKIKIAPTKIASRYFTDAEQAYIFAPADCAAVQYRFFEVWTKKEAYIKCTGNGLSESLRSFCVQSGIPNYAFYSYTFGAHQLAVCASAPLYTETPVILAPAQVIADAMRTLEKPEP